MGIGFSDLVSMGTQAAGLMGKGKETGGLPNLISNATRVWSEFKKYPQTMDGLKQALSDYNVTKEQANDAMSTLSSKFPELQKMVDSKLPGSLGAIMNTLNTTGLPSGGSVVDVTKSTNITSEGYNQSDRLQSLLQASKRK